MKRFQVSQSLSIKFPNQATSLWRYLEQPARLLTAMTSAQQVQELKDSTFRVRLHSLEFMNLVFQPVVDLMIWTQSDTKLCLKSSNCKLLGSTQLQKSFELDFNGYLSRSQHRSLTCLKGEADLAIAVEIPPVLRILPEIVLNKAVETFLSGILMTFKYRLEQRLVQDYYAWVQRSQSVMPEAA